MAYKNIFVSDIVLIKKILVEIEENCSKEKDEKHLASLAKTNKAKDLFANDAVVDIVSSKYYFLGASEISSAILNAKHNVDWVKFKFLDIEIKFPTKMKAKVNLTVKIEGEQNSPEAEQDYRSLEMMLIKQKNKWLIQKIIEIELFNLETH